MIDKERYHPPHAGIETLLLPKGAELVHDWADLVPDEQVFQSGHEAGSSLGSVDAVSEDGAILWLHLENGAAVACSHATATMSGDWARGTSNRPRNPNQRQFEQGEAGPAEGCWPR